VTVKKINWILIAVALLAVVLAPALAFADNGPHGGYVADTDMCAQCHRAHTAPSSITWTDNQGAQKNALLLTDSQQGYLFCLACHDDASQGADTNVMGGVYQGTAYGTPGADLISGAFGSVGATLGAVFDQHGAAVTSQHLITGAAWGAYGGGLYGETSETITARGTLVDLPGTGNHIVMTCTTCHDPHGSSNYRILKDVVNGVTVGGYDGSATGTDPFGHAYSAQNPKPNPYVISNEPGFPQGGFLLHKSYAGIYTPNYTTANYAIPSAASKGMTAWCTGCHTTYNSTTSAYDSEGIGSVAVDRHRHPMNVPLSNYAGTATLTADVSLGLPLDHPTSEQAGGKAYTTGDWIECLTCHNAHGSTATMSGWADLGAPSTVDVVGDRGVMPVDSNLLKMNNRGVCEACHNK
jgi:predicted CXXCH cytochrome family protein